MYSKEEHIPGFRAEVLSKNLEVDIIRENEILGEEALLNDGISIFSAMTLSHPTVVYAVTRARFGNSRKILGQTYDKMLETTIVKINFRLDRMKQLEAFNDVHRLDLTKKHNSNHPDNMISDNLWRESSLNGVSNRQNLLEKRDSGNPNIKDVQTLKKNLEPFLFKVHIPSKNHFFMNKEPLKDRNEKRINYLAGCSQIAMKKSKVMESLKKDMKKL